MLTDNQVNIIKIVGLKQDQIANIFHMLLKDFQKDLVKKAKKERKKDKDTPHYDAVRMIRAWAKFGEYALLEKEADKVIGMIIGD